MPVKGARMSGIDELEKHILADIVVDFRAKNLGADALRKHYVGLSIPALENHYVTNGTYSKVDFDLALKQLEATNLIKTGPMFPYENPPGSNVLVIAFFSKRDYAYLTERGYREALKAPPKRASGPNVHISGGTFHQSPIGVGTTVNQPVSFNLDNDPEVIEQLCKLLAQHDPAAGDDAKRDVINLVTVAKAGDLAKVKPLFERLFGTAKDAIKQIALGVITAYVTHQMGLSP
jgi:hypothetical protein